MYIERDTRRQQTVGKADSQAQANYLTKCLELITNYLVEIVPQIFGKSCDKMCLNLQLCQILEVPYNFYQALCKNP